MQCFKCEKMIPEGSNFCPYCGKKVLICSVCNCHVRALYDEHNEICETCYFGEDDVDTEPYTDEEWGDQNAEDYEPQEVSLGDPNDPMSLKGYE